MITQNSARSKSGVEKDTRQSVHSAACPLPRGMLRGRSAPTQTWEAAHSSRFPQKTRTHTGVFDFAVTAGVLPLVPSRGIPLPRSMPHVLNDNTAGDGVPLRSTGVRSNHTLCIKIYHKAPGVFKENGSFANFCRYAHKFWSDLIPGAYPSCGPPTGTRPPPSAGHRAPRRRGRP